MTAKKKLLIGVTAGVTLALLRAVRSMPEVSVDWKFVLGFVMVGALFIVVSTIFAYFSEEKTFPKIFKESLLAPSIVAALIPGTGGGDVSQQTSGDSAQATIEDVGSPRTNGSFWDMFVATAHAQPAPAARTNQPVTEIKKGDYEPSSFDRAKQMLGLRWAPNSWTYVIQEASDSAAAAKIATGIRTIPGINAQDVWLVRTKGKTSVFVSLRKFDGSASRSMNNFYHSYTIQDTARVRTDPSLRANLNLLRNGTSTDLRNLVPK